MPLIQTDAFDGFSVSYMYSSSCCHYADATIFYQLELTNAVHFL